MSKNDLLLAFETGQVITQANMHDFINNAHNEVEGVFSATTQRSDEDGIQVFWVKTGNVYSFWINHVVQTVFRADNLLANNAISFPAVDIPPLLDYQGSPSYIMMDSFDPTLAASTARDLVAIVDSNGIYLKSTSNNTSAIVNQNSIIVLNFIMVLG